MKLHRHDAEPWRNQSRAMAELFCRGHFPPGGGNHHQRHHQWSSHREQVNLHQHLHQHHLLSNPSSSLVSNLVSKTTNCYLWVASSVDYSLWLILIGLLGGRSYVQILHAYYYTSDYEHDYALWVVTFVPEDMGEVLLLVVMWIWYSFDILMRCMLSFL